MENTWPEKFVMNDYSFEITSTGSEHHYEFEATDQYQNISFVIEMAYENGEFDTRYDVSRDVANDEEAWSYFELYLYILIFINSKKQTWFGK